jgi:hypothetical protein
MRRRAIPETIEMVIVMGALDCAATGLNVFDN